MASAPSKNSVKQALLARKVRLWEPPYFVEERPDEAKLKELAASVASEVGQTADVVTAILADLQEVSIANARNRQLFKEKGIATVTIRLAHKHFTTGVQDTDKNQIQIDVAERGGSLKATIAACVGVGDPQMIKCIVRGKFIDDDMMLSSQGLTNEDVVMVLISEGGEEVDAAGELVRDIEQIRLDSQTLSHTQRQDGDYVQFRNQFGAPLDIPEDQRVALVTAMTLYESGRKYLKQLNYSDALLYFLESDSEFRKCNCALLDSVDNYALLNLDIVWCYLCLRSVTALPDAGRRLEMAEKTLIKTYGMNFERVQAVKQHEGGERANMSRLRLMQGILEYHRGNMAKSERLFNGVRGELEKLKVDDDLISHMVALGHSAFTARWALRACGNDLAKAINFVEETAKKKEEMRKARQVESRKRRMEKELGFLPGAKRVRLRVELFEQLMSFGYTQQQARLGLIRGKNSLSAALDALTLTCKSSDPDIAMVTDELGFLPMEVEHALRMNGNDLRKATDALLQNTYATADADEDDPQTTSGSTSATSVRSGTSVDSDASSSASNASGDSTALADEALERLAPTMPTNDEEYLDFSLDMEEKFLKDYLELLRKDRA